jgi:hypothetical protein
MAYYTGSAVSFAAVKTALVNASVTDGWTNTADAGGNVVLSKSGVFVQVVDALDELAFLGRTSLDAGDAPGAVTFGDITVNAPQTGMATAVVSFPLTYHIFTVTNEVFLVIGYGDLYQWATFGLSTQAGLTGTGAFVGASWGATRTPTFAPIYLTALGGRVSYGEGCPALFWQTTAISAKQRNCFVNTNIDPLYPWDMGLVTASSVITGIKPLTELLNTQPNAFNSESVLLPIRAYKDRPDSKISQTAEVENARCIRNDNYNNEQIITLGLDKWMVFPWYRKNITDRNCAEQWQDHTGTFGWAIKYEGP